MPFVIYVNGCVQVNAVLSYFFYQTVLGVQYQPKGVVGVIVPWNFPVYLALAHWLRP